MNKAARENRICVCGCGQMFETKKTSCKKYVNREHYYRHKDRGLRVPEETRECACGCGETFVSKINSGRRYICGHNGRGLFNPSSTTTSLQAIVEATAVYLQSRRDSLNCMETCRKEQK